MNKFNRIIDEMIEDGLKTGEVSKSKLNDGLVCLDVKTAMAVLEILEDETLCNCEFLPPKVLGHESWTHKAYRKLKEAIEKAN